MNIQIYISSLEADLLAPGSPARPRDLWSETLYSNYFGNIDNSIARNNMFCKDRRKFSEVISLIF